MEKKFVEREIMKLAHKKRKSENRREEEKEERDGENVGYVGKKKGEGEVIKGEFYKDCQGSNSHQQQKTDLHP